MLQAVFGGLAEDKSFFCKAPSGWGNHGLVPTGDDLTACTYSAVTFLPSAVLLVFGTVQMIHLYLKPQRNSFKPNITFYIKELLTTIYVSANVVSFVRELNVNSGSLADVRIWSPLFQAVAGLLAIALHAMEEMRSSISVASLLIFWAMSTCFGALRLWSVARSVKNSQTYIDLVIAVVKLACSFVTLLAESSISIGQGSYHQVKTLDLDSDAAPESEICPVDRAHLLSRLTFSWITPLMKLGYRHYLTEKDLWNIPEEDKAKPISDMFSRVWEKSGGSLLRTMVRCHANPMAIAYLFKTCSDILAFIQPQLLKRLIQFVNAYSTKTSSSVPGFALAISMFLVSVLQTAALHQYFQHSLETGLRMRSQLNSAIYRKSLVLSNDGRENKSTGDIVNHMSVDSQKVSDVPQYLLLGVSGPFQIILCFVSMYFLLGWSFLAGVGVMVLMIPINAWIANISKKNQQIQMGNKDARTRLMTEILNNIKSIKLYAWENTFMQRLSQVRNNQELRMLKRIGVINAASNFTWSCAPFLVSCSTFLVYVLTTDKALSTEIVFPALTLFNLLQFPLTVFPLVITYLVEASVAVERLRNYLSAKEVQRDAVRREPPALIKGQVAVRVKQGTFNWSEQVLNQPTLSNIEFVARKGELACIVGRVGSGKTSFLETLIGNLVKFKGDVLVRGSVAYVAQSPWIMNASIMENIVFGHKFDRAFYDETVAACALLDDFKALPDGDQTEVGEKGISLSGGQKARLSLARAVYARADVYLLDDLLSAVDQHVGRHLTDHVVGPSGLLSGKTRVLSTNNIGVLSSSDTITMIENGQIVETGTLNECLDRKVRLYTLIQEFGKSTKKRPTGSEDSSQAQVTSEDASEDLDEHTVNDVQEKARRFSTGTLRRASVASFTKPHGRITDEENKQGSQLQERSQQGKVQWSVYGEYAKASSTPAFITYLVALVISQACSVSGNLWLKHWSEVNSRYNANPHAARYISIYFALGVGSSVFMVICTLILWIFCAIRSAKHLHDRMAFAVFHSPMSFFETTPIGRIMNRFSNDVFKVDEILARVLSMFFRNAFQVMFVLIVISIGTPIFIALILPLTFIYIWVQQYYLRTSRELKRLDSTTRSPIFAHFQESLGGVSTIRAYDQGPRFALENEWRLDINQKAWYLYISANRWLAVRLEFLGSVIILSAAVLGVAGSVSGTVSPGILGLSMSYAVQITQSLNWVVRQTVDVETNIVSVERILEYSQLKSEAPYEIPDRSPPSEWPDKGHLVFQNYSTKYREGLPNVLRDVNADIKPREKIGIVGRTGAGKSSLTLALFRIIEPTEGTVFIDGVDCRTLGLHQLRSNLAIIPQDSQAFDGTFRENLDPAGEHDDATILRVVEQVHLKALVDSMPEGMHTRISEGGNNISSGQRQLMCIGRALLRPSKILVLDEATAAVDVETDKLLQETIRKEFKDRTILTIAHRINTIMDADRIMVLAQGQIAEFDSPQTLLARGENSLFYHLARESGLVKGEEE